MKTLNKTLLALVAGTVMTAGANAALYQTNTVGYAGQPYVGLKVGQSQLDINTSGYDTDNPTVYGVYGGYNFTPNFGVEAQYLGADKVDLKNDAGTKVGDVKQQTMGAYGTYRYAFPNSNLYAKGKLGFAQNKIEMNNVSVSSEDSTTGLAGGVGLGYNLTPNVSLEAEYEKLPTVSQSFTKNDTDSDLLTIGAHMKF